MKKRKGIFALMSIICLLGVLTMSISMAAGVEDPVSRQEDLNFLYENLQKDHPDLFANTPESTFLERKAEIESRLDTESDTEFVLDLQSLVALVGDSHTNLSISSISKDSKYYPMKITWIDGTWILSVAENEYKDLLGNQVVAINNLSMDQVLDRFAKFISADNRVKLRRVYKQSCYVESLYEYAGIVTEDGPLIITLKDQEGQESILKYDPIDLETLKNVDFSYLSDLRTATSDTELLDKYYASKALDDHTYYIQYNQCVQNPELSMEAFCSQVKNDLDQGHYSKVLVDLRQNGGGSDGVIIPLLMLLREEMDTKAVQVIGLIGEATFSSAIINAVELQEMGCILVGESTSGSVSHFGAVNSFQLPHSEIKVQVSSKYIDLSAYFDSAVGKGIVSLVPDVEIAQTLEDYLDGRDTCVEKLLEDSEFEIASDQESIALTRGRFMGMLYDAFGSPDQTIKEKPFSDLIGFEWYLPALNWAASENIASGTGGNCFSSVRTITWQEATLFMVNSARVMGLELKEIRTDEPPESLMDAAWDKSAIETAWKWGLLPEGADFNISPTRAQGELMIEALGVMN